MYRALAYTDAYWYYEGNFRERISNFPQLPPKSLACCATILDSIIRHYRAAVRNTQTSYAASKKNMEDLLKKREPPTLLEVIAQLKTRHVKKISLDQILSCILNFFRNILAPR